MFIKKLLLQLETKLDGKTKKIDSQIFIYFLINYIIRFCTHTYYIRTRSSLVYK